MRSGVIENDTPAVRRASSLFVPVNSIQAGQAVRSGEFTQCSVEGAGDREPQGINRLKLICVRLVHGRFPLEGALIFL
jgi:hypothetical protein